MSTAQIHITLKPALLDTQGATVLKALHQLGHQSVRDVRIGKLIEVRLDDALPPAQQQAQLEAMCQQLLANPVIEDFNIVISNAATSGTANGNGSANANVSANANLNAPSSTRTSAATTAMPSAATTNTSPATTAMPISATMPIANLAPLGSEPTAIAEPFAVSYQTYQSMTAEEKLDLQGRAWNLHGATVMNELNARRAAWIVQCGNRVLDSGSSLDSFPSDAQLAIWGAQIDLVPFVFTRPPQ